MKITAKFVINRRGFRDQVLLDNGAAEIVDTIKPSVAAAAPPGTTVEVSRSYGAEGRVRIRIVDEADDAADRESKDGALSKALNRLKV